jgi:hypothetical protein
VVDGGRTTVQADRDRGLSWLTMHREFTAYAARVLPDTPPTVADDRPEVGGSMLVCWIVGEGENWES